MWPVKTFSPSLTSLPTSYSSSSILHPPMYWYWEEGICKGHKVNPPLPSLFTRPFLLLFLQSIVRPITERNRGHDDFSFFSFFFFFFFTVTLMCRINAVGHFTKRQVHCVAGWSGGVTSGSHSETAGHLGNFLDWLRAVGDISDPKWLEHRQCSRTTFSFNQCRSIGMQCSQYVASEGLFTLEDEV